MIQVAPEIYAVKLLAGNALGYYSRTQALAVARRADEEALRVGLLNTLPPVTVERQIINAPPPPPPPNIADEIVVTAQPLTIIGTARNANAPFNLVVSPRTTTISGPLLKAITEAKGSIYVFDPAAGTLKRFGT